LVFPLCADPTVHFHYPPPPPLPPPLFGTLADTALGSSFFYPLNPGPRDLFFFFPLFRENVFLHSNRPVFLQLPIFCFFHRRSHLFQAGSLPLNRECRLTFSPAPCRGNWAQFFYPRFFHVCFAVAVPLLPPPHPRFFQKTSPLYPGPFRPWALSLPSMAFRAKGVHSRGVIFLYFLERNPLFAFGILSPLYSLSLPPERLRGTGGFFFFNPLPFVVFLFVSGPGRFCCLPLTLRTLAWDGLKAPFSMYPTSATRSVCQRLLSPHRIAFFFF